MIVLDASVLVAYFESRDAHHERAVNLLRGIAEETWGAAAITMAELLVGPAGRGDEQLITAVDTLAALGVTQIPDPPGTPAQLAQLRASTRLKMPDCYVLLAAKASGGAIASFDLALLRAAKARDIETIHN